MLYTFPENYKIMKEVEEEKEQMVKKRL